MEHGTFVPLGFFATEDEAARAVAAHHDSFVTEASQYVGKYGKVAGIHQYWRHTKAPGPV